MVANYLMIINIAVYVLLMLVTNLVPGLYHNIATNLFLWLPETVFNFKIWELFTYMFIHDLAGLGHIFFNMFALMMFGREIESYIGHVNFLFFYLFAGVGAGLVQMAVQFIQLIYASSVNGYSLTDIMLMSKSNPVILMSADIVPVVGASGAIFGLLLAYGRLFPDREILLFFMIPMRAKQAVIVFGVIELALGFSGVGRVAHFAHLGGLLFGWIYFTYLIHPANQLIRKKFLNLERFFMKKANGQ